MEEAVLNTALAPASMWHTVVEQFVATSPWEATASLLGLAYLLLAVRRNLLCWLCAFVST